MKWVELKSKIIPSGNIDLPFKVVFNKPYAHYLFKTKNEAEIFAGVTFKNNI